MRSSLIALPALLALAACSADSDGTAPNDAAAAQDSAGADVPVDASPGVDVAEEDVDDGAGAHGDASADASPDAAADADQDVAPPCTPGSLQCDGKVVQLCQGGVWISGQVCSGESTCADGQCVEAADCVPGTVLGCAAIDARKVCSEDGTAALKVPCPPGEKCLDGACAVLACLPGTSSCASVSATRACAADGSAWLDPVECAQGTSCIGGKCLSACEGDLKYNTNVGCRFWSLDLGQWEVKPGQLNVDKSVDPIPHAVVVANPGTLPATVTFSSEADVTFQIADPVVPGGAVRAFEMPVMSLQNSAVSELSIRFVTDRPVIAAQFNPLNNVFAFSNDGSLLLPEPAFGTEYIAATLPSVMPPPIIKSPTVWGYVTVAATAPGETQVTVVPRCPTEAGPELPSFPAGEPAEFTLQQWQVLNLNGLADTNGTNDLTGTLVTTDKPAAAFSGHQCMSISSNCDHLETQLLPVSAWGNSYIAVSTGNKADIFRVISGADDNLITAIPPVPGVSGVTLQKGQWVESKAAHDFQVAGTGPLQVVQYLTVDDPSMSILVPTDRFLDDYPVLVPAGFANNSLIVIRKPGALVTLDQIPISGSTATVGAGQWERVIVWVGAGVHRVASDAPFGLMLYGWDSAVSYLVPGGMATGGE